MSRIIDTISNIPECNQCGSTNHKKVSSDQGDCHVIFCENDHVIAINLCSPNLNVEWIKEQEEER